jgi:hypothetical protein
MAGEQFQGYAMIIHGSLVNLFSWCPIISAAGTDTVRLPV